MLKNTTLCSVIPHDDLIHHYGAFLATNTKTREQTLYEQHGWTGNDYTYVAYHEDGYSSTFGCTGENTFADMYDKDTVFQFVDAESIKFHEVTFSFVLGFDERE